jgi:hypothetical protein
MTLGERSFERRVGGPVRAAHDAVRVLDGSRGPVVERDDRSQPVGSATGRRKGGSRPWTVRSGLPGGFP